MGAAAASSPGTRLTPSSPARSSRLASSWTQPVMSVSAGPPLGGLYLKPPSSGGLWEGVTTIPSARCSRRSRFQVRMAWEMAGVRAQATAVGLTELVCFGGRARLFPVDDLPESKQVRLDRLYPGAVWKQAERSLLVPLPADGTNLPTWLCELLTGILGAPDAPALPDTARPERRRAAS